MTQAIPEPAVAVNSSVGSTILAVVVQGLSWLAFGACFCGGWHVTEWLLKKL